MNTLELPFELEKIRALVNCLDDAITNAVTGNPSSGPSPRITAWCGCTPCSATCPATT